MNVDKAREILGVSKDVTLEELEDRFFILVKRETEAQRSNSHIDNTRQEELSKAYQLIKDELLEENSDDENKKKKSPFFEKLDHFIYYYKFHVLAGIAIVVLVGYLASSIIENQIEKQRLENLPPAAVKVLVIGEYHTGSMDIEFDLTPLEENIMELFPEWERIQLDFMYAPKEMQSQQDMAFVMRNQAEMASLQPHILITDRHTFDSYSAAGGLLSLDSLDATTLNQIDDERLLYNKSEHDEKEHLSGIDITDSKLFEGIDMSAEQILTVIDREANKENSLHFATKVAEALTKE